MSSVKNVSLSVLLLIASLALWEGIVRVFDVAVFILPAPSISR
jgi:ABC-type nitrate/sulfonate/bicarbonate transport system permease component